jgi:hypothetical protein
MSSRIIARWEIDDCHYGNEQGTNGEKPQKEIEGKSPEEIQAEKEKKEIEISNKLIREKLKGIFV